MPSSPANGTITYSVQRKLGAGAYTDVSSGGCAGTKAYGTTSCADTPAATGSYSYRVVATFATWTATSAESGPVALLVDTTAPTVSSIVRGGASPSNAGSVSWTVTFSEAATGVDAADFALARTGALSGGTVSSVSGSGTTYTVTASTGTGSGTLGLDLADDDSIIDVAANPLGGAGAGNGNFTGQTYTLDKTGPAASSIARVIASPTNAGSVSWIVTFNESVTGVGTADFGLAATGTPGAAITGISGSGTSYTVTASTFAGPGSGTLGLNLVDDDTIIDTLGNPLGGVGAGNGAFPGAIYTIDRTPPSVPTSISVTSGVLWTAPVACTGIVTNTRYINATATSASTSTVTMTAAVAQEPGLLVYFAATSAGVTITSPGQSGATSPVTTTQSLTTLTDGPITLTAYAVDSLGNTSTSGSSTGILIKDTIVPALSADYQEDFLGANPRVVGNSECGVTVTAVRTGGGNLGAPYWMTITPGPAYNLPVQGSLLGLGTVKYAVTGVERSGNISATVNVTG